MLERCGGAGTRPAGGCGATVSAPPTLATSLQASRRSPGMEYDLTDEERDAIVGLLTTEIEASRFPLSPRIERLNCSICGRPVMAGSPDAGERVNLESP